MNTTPRDEPAFPCDWIDRDSTGKQVVIQQFSGMTLRDYFAAKAMAAMLVQDAFVQNWSNGKVAEYAYDVADCMIIQREVSK